MVEWKWCPNLGSSPNPAPAYVSKREEPHFSYLTNTGLHLNNLYKKTVLVLLMPSLVNS